MGGLWPLVASGIQSPYNNKVMGGLWPLVASGIQSPYKTDPRIWC